MLVHPTWYVVRRVPSVLNVSRFVVDQTQTGKSLCCYEVDASGVVTLRPP